MKKMGIGHEKGEHEASSPATKEHSDQARGRLVKSRGALCVTFEHNAARTSTKSSLRRAWRALSCKRGKEALEARHSSKRASSCA